MEPNMPIGSGSCLTIGNHNKIIKKKYFIFLIKISLVLNVILFLVFLFAIIFWNCERIHKRALKFKILQKHNSDTLLPFHPHGINWMEGGIGIRRTGYSNSGNGIGNPNNSPRLTHVIIPFHVKQLGKMIYFMEQWDLFPPCPDPKHLNDLLSLLDSNNNNQNHDTRTSMKREQNDNYNEKWKNELFGKAKNTKGNDHFSFANSLGRNVTLIVFMNTRYDLEIETKIAKTFHSLLDRTKSCFSGIRFRYADLVGEKDSYLMGSRMMFELMMQGNAAMDNPGYAFYMEPDCLPIRSNWLSLVDSHTRWPNPPFWLKGSIFRGDMKIVGTTNIVNMFHINGNAIYNLRDLELQRFYFRRVRKFIEDKVKKEGAYDTDVAMYLQNGHFLTEALDIAHKFQFSEFIQNLYHSNYSISGLAKKNRVTVMVHGGYPQT